ncbi:MAG: ABC transporter permease [Candidatus Bipolaricaulis sp.]|nr:ABC transporter permease [Candidatus Bipolaricaulis sp.]
MGLHEMLRTAVTALRAHKMRTTLSVLGIVIGVAAIVAIIAIVNGATASMKEQISGLGMRTINVTIFPNAISAASSARALTDELTGRFEALPSVSKAVPTSSSNARAIIDGEEYSASIAGVVPEYAELFDGFYPTSGRFIYSMDDNRRVIVLGAGFAEDYFAGEDPVGRRITLEISNQKLAFTIIGVMSARGRVGMQDLDDTIFVPLSTVQLLSGSRQFTSYIAQAESETVVDTAAEEIEGVLKEVISTTSTSGSSSWRGPRTPYNVSLQQQFIETYESTVGTMTLILGGVAAIALLVGGIGIMNIMLVSVTERTREIGIRLAIGARPRDIRTQFLVEAILTSSLGGLIGLAAGWLCAWLGSLLGDWPFVMSVYPALLAVGFSLLIGVTFGLYPAVRAARLDPVEALRYE